MEIKTDVSYLKSVKCADVYTESQTDYVLPDYLGDVRKILFTEAALRPSGRFAGGDEVEFSGIVVYNVIYLDAEGHLSSVEFTSDYDYSVKCSGESYNDSIADTRVSNYAIRLVGPRKINAKASLAGSVRLSENSTLCASGSAFEGDSTPEINMGSADVRVSKISSVSEREYAESVAKLEGAIVDEVSVVHSYAECTVDEIHAEEDSVCVKGKLRMCAVMKNADEPAYGVEKAVSFEEHIDFDGITPDMSLVPQLTVSSLNSNVNADDTGCEVVMSCIVEFYVIGEGNQHIDLLLDGYLKDCPTDNNYEEFSYTKLIEVSSSKSSHTAEIDRADIESEGLREIIFLTSTPKVEKLEKENGRVTVLGEIKYSGIASEMIGDQISYTGIKLSSPFSININNNCQINDKTRIEAEIHTSNASATLDAERVYVSCTIEGVVVVSEEESERVLSAMSRLEGESYESDEAKITVYYPTSSDTLFSVAKRFHTSGLKVASDNDISESVFASDSNSGGLAGVKKLIIY